MIPDHSDGETATLVAGAVGCAGAWIVFAALEAGARRSGMPIRRIALRGEALRIVIAGGMIVGGPAIAFLLPQTVYAVDFAIAMTLTPVVLSIASAWFETSSAADAGGRIWPGLLGLTGLLMLFAQPVLTDAGADCAYVLAPLLTGIGAALFGSSKVDAGGRRGLALGGGVASLSVISAISVVHSGSLAGFTALSAAIDGLLAAATIVALDQLGPERWSAQYVLVPLLIVVQGMIYARSYMSGQALAGLGLLVVAAGALLLRPSDAGTSLRSASER